MSSDGRRHVAGRDAVDLRSARSGRRATGMPRRLVRFRSRRIHRSSSGKVRAPEGKGREVTAQDFVYSWNDYPESASNNACKVLRWRDQHGDEVKGMTRVGWVRANQLCRKENISEETIARMASFARHRQNSTRRLGDGCGRLMWLAWGGDEGIAWAQRKIEQLNKSE